MADTNKPGPAEKTMPPGPRTDVPKEDWADYADTTLAHNRGSQGDAQLAAEGRTLPTTLHTQPKAETATAPDAPERAVATPDADGGPAELAGLTVKDLKARAKEAGVEGFATMNKAQLVAALRQ